MGIDAGRHGHRQQCLRVHQVEMTGSIWLLDMGRGANADTHSSP
jgi:hypothetical protein